MLLLVLFSASVATARPLHVIQERGVLSLCAHANALPFASKNADPPGFQIEIARALARELGVALEVEWVTTGYQFRSVDCDIVLDTIGVAEAQAERRLLLSRPYQRSGVGLALPPRRADVTTFDNLVGHRVAVQVGSLAAMLLGRRGVRTVPFGFEEEMLDAVIGGRVEAAAVSPASAEYWNAIHRETPLRFVNAYESEPELSWDLTVGLRRADGALRDAIDRAIERLGTEGTIGAIYARYGIGYRPPRSR
ncbi:MAG: ABC transporter substrate-binding protein [Candidatus Rokuibacteriota bacterium]|nr:MAG: ABC transporter substrate-binding protein [Candidatus Rokubacteria bacterium]